MAQMRKIVIIALAIGMLVVSLSFSGCAIKVSASTPAEVFDEKVTYEKPWWKFPGFEAVFAMLGCIYYILMLKVLPLLIQKKGGI